MTRLFSHFTVFYLGFGLAALPFLFIYNDIFSDKQAPTRMFLIACYQIFAMLLFAGQNLRRDLTSAMQPRTWALIGFLAVIAFSKLLLDIGNAQLVINRSIMWVLHVIFTIGAIAELRKLTAAQIRIFMLISFGIGAMLYFGTVLAVEMTRIDVNQQTCSTSLPGFGNVRYTGYFAAFAYMFYLSISAQDHTSTWLRYTCLLGAVITLFFIIYTGSRGALVASCFAILASAILLGGTSLRMLTTAIITVIIASTFIFLTAPHDCPAFNAFLRIAATPDLTAGTISSGRTVVWAASFELFIQRPLLGQGEIRLWEVTDYGITQAHNSILQSLMTWGVIGASCFWGLVLTLMRNIHKTTKTDPMTYMPYTSAIIVMLAYSMIDATLYYSYPLLLITFAIIAIFASAADAR